MTKRKAPGDENVDPASRESDVIDELSINEDTEELTPLKSYQEQLEGAIRSVFDGESHLFTDDEWTLLFTFLTLEGILKRYYLLFT
jgi:hypothetical protein